MNSELIKHARSLLNNSEFTEFIAILAGIKPAMRSYGDGVKSHAIRELAEALDLAFLESPYVVISGKSTDNFIHTAHIENHKPETASELRHIFIGADVLAVNLVQIFDITDSRRFGLALGYPKCCVEFFYQNYSTQHFDLISDIAKPEDDFYPWQLNHACRYFDYALISHFPCRWDCPASMQIAHDTFKALVEYDSDLACATSLCLESDVLYTPTRVLAMRPDKISHFIDLAQTPYWLSGNSENIRSIQILESKIILIMADGTNIPVDNAVWLPFHSQLSLHIISEKDK